MPVVPPVFVDIFCNVYGDKMKRLYERNENRWKDIKSSLEASLKIKQDPINMVCLSAMIRIEFEAKIRTDKENPLIVALNEKV